MKRKVLEGSCLSVCHKESKRDIVFRRKRFEATKVGKGDLGTEY